MKGNLKSFSETVPKDLSSLVCSISSIEEIHVINLSPSRIRYEICASKLSKRKRYIALRFSSYQAVDTQRLTWPSLLVVHTATQLRYNGFGYHIWFSCISG